MGCLILKKSAEFLIGHLLIWFIKQKYEPVQKMNKIDEGLEVAQMVWNLYGDFGDLLWEIFEFHIYCSNFGSSYPNEENF